MNCSLCCSDEVLGSQSFNLHVCACPHRDRLKAEDALLVMAPVSSTRKAEEMEAEDSIAQSEQNENIAFSFKVT